MAIHRQLNGWKELRRILDFVNQNRGRKALQEQERIAFCQGPEVHIVKGDIRAFRFAKMFQQTGLADLARAS